MVWWIVKNYIWVFGCGDDVIIFNWWRHQKSVFLKGNGKINVTFLVFILRSWLTPQMKANKFLFQNKLHSLINFASSRSYSRSFPGNNGKNGLWRHNDVTWSDFDKNFRKCNFYVHNDAVKIWSPNNNPIKSYSLFPICCLTIGKQHARFTSCWLIPYNFRSTDAITLKISWNTSNR